MKQAAIGRFELSHVKVFRLPLLSSPRINLHKVPKMGRNSTVPRLIN
ncbi:hypothetical protein HMPREF1588_01721 [Escherichia coli 110957]|uniref:Uncharacterized protein n=5 Tax=Gammaproteobacteria TaxID=1236 RepID=A0A4P8G8U6_ECOLX|nr:hypothetical protein Vcrx067 [Vibrio cholerae]AYU66077.1 hypothetical protein [Citrobacter freundii]ESA76198.1 hypothetical protein HMPREF1588_01721 [Escherichia coli 110957]QCF28705.1 hypothetical protein [Escherichia coli J53]QCO89646.1 hypothetical protein [Escherichia coli]QKY87633.1 hypothetical protein [Klebsiella pneumoniae]QTK22668.1 hypothetical protein [Vibrio parahaemolyticus]CCG28671.1 hypothetical protein [Klebsiella aerogenes EA1509E]